MVFAECTNASPLLLFDHPLSVCYDGGQAAPGGPRYLGAVAKFIKYCTDFTIPPGGVWNASLFDTGIVLRTGQTVIFSAKGSVRPSTNEDVSTLDRTRRAKTQAGYKSGLNLCCKSHRRWDQAELFGRFRSTQLGDTKEAEDGGAGEGDGVERMRKRGPRLALITIGYLIFCGISLLSRFVYPFFGLVVLVGIVLPLVWGRFTGEWAAMGFSKRNVGKALLWGVGAGVVTSAVGLVVLGERSAASHVGQQLLIGVPFWLLIISPFQEFFFRGWMQSGLEEVLGGWWGLVVANVCFTLWHYVSPIVDMATFPLASVVGVTSTFVAGLVYGYAFQQSRNIVSPWLGHAISGIVFVIVGAMDFVQAMS